MPTVPDHPCLWCTHKAYHIPGGTCIITGCVCQAILGQQPGEVADIGHVVTAKMLKVLDADETYLWVVGPEDNLAFNNDKNKAIRIRRQDVLDAAFPLPKSCPSAWLIDATDQYAKCDLGKGHEGWHVWESEEGEHQYEWKDDYPGVLTFADS